MRHLSVISPQIRQNLTIANTQTRHKRLVILDRSGILEIIIGKLLQKGRSGGGFFLRVVLVDNYHVKNTIALDLTDARDKTDKFFLITL
jgi:hypothetical protein